MYLPVHVTEPNSKKLMSNGQYMTHTCNYTKNFTNMNKIKIHETNKATKITHILLYKPTQQQYAPLTMVRSCEKLGLRNKNR